MNWKQLCVLLPFLGMCSLTALAFTLKSDYKLIGQREEDAGLQTRDNRRGFPRNESQLVYKKHQLDPRQQTKSTDWKGEVKSKNRQLQKELNHSEHKKKFEGLHQFVRDRNAIRSVRDERHEIAKSEALLHEVSKSDLQNTVPKMVVVVATTVAGLFGMCVMAAIFQCCCRKKRTHEESNDTDAIKSDTNDEKKSKPSSAEREKTPEYGPDEKSENDKLLNDEELGDFSVVQRETEILKSYRKPPPPKNRARASRVPRMKAAGSKEDLDSFSQLIQEESDVNRRSKTPVSQRNTPERNVSSEEPNLEARVEKRLSYNTASDMADNATTEVKGETTPTEIPNDGNAELQSSSDLNVSEAKPNGANIFLQIDPTIKKDNTEEKVKGSTKIPVRTGSAPSSEAANLRPKSAHKEQRKFLVPSVHGEHMDQLVKSLKSRLKEDTTQSARNLTSNKVSPTNKDDDTEPQERERSHSDPTKPNLKGLKQTHL